MPFLFSYGTLQQEPVQLSTFGRLLHGRRDELVGFEQSLFEITDPDFVAASGKAHHAIVTCTGRPEDRVSGMVFEISDEELAAADAYEPAGYVRTATTLASGTEAWVYADASLDELRQIATAFRAGIERARDERASPHLPYFPDGACKIASLLFAMHLAGNTRRSIRLVSGHFPGGEQYARHTWLEVDGATVDLTADPFGQPPVVVGRPTTFHTTLDSREEGDAIDAIRGLAGDEAKRYSRWLERIEERLS